MAKKKELPPINTVEDKTVNQDFENFRDIVNKKTSEEEERRREERRRYEYEVSMYGRPLTDYDRATMGNMTRRSPYEPPEYIGYRDPYPSRGMMGSYGDPWYSEGRYNDRRMERRPGTAIVCPVCMSDRCNWWEQMIMRNTAGQILKDMLTTGFKGEGYYERYGGQDTYQQQEEYYQRMKAQFEAMNKPRPEQPVKTEDVDHDVVSTDIKGKPKKQIEFKK